MQRRAGDEWPGGYRAGRAGDGSSVSLGRDRETRSQTGLSVTEPSPNWTFRRQNTVVALLHLVFCEILRHLCDKQWAYVGPDIWLYRRVRSVIVACNS